MWPFTLWIRKQASSILGISTHRSCRAALAGGTIEHTGLMAWDDTDYLDTSDGDSEFHAPRDLVSRAYYDHKITQGQRTLPCADRTGPQALRSAVLNIA